MSTFSTWTGAAELLWEDLGQLGQPLRGAGQRAHRGAAGPAGRHGAPSAEESDQPGDRVQGRQGAPFSKSKGRWRSFFLLLWWNPLLAGNQQETYHSEGFPNVGTSVYIYINTFASILSCYLSIYLSIYLSSKPSI